MASRETLFVLFLIVVSANCSKLNVVRVLLPIFDDFPTNFTLQATDNSCFKWSHTRRDIITVTPVDPTPDLGCSPRAIISTITKDKVRAFSDVLAEDVATRQTLRCVIIVDKIDSLEITTTTRDLILEEAPEVFEVRAYDIQGNEFSTLVGVPFEWAVTPLGPNKDMPVMRFMAFTDSPYETPESLVDIEYRNLRGHKVLLEGIKTGMSKVTVSLPHKDYLFVKSNEIILTVIANLMIVPSEMFIIKGDEISLKVIHTSYGRSEYLQLKNSNYYLDVEDKKIATSERESAKVTGLQEGTTTIVLHDKNIDENEPGLKLPSAKIHVVAPAYMRLNLQPYKNWATLVSENHDILVEIYSKDDRKLNLGPQVFVQTQIGDAFHVNGRTPNGTWHTGWTDHEGIAEVTAVLESVGKTKLQPPLTATAQILIYPRITLIPMEVILPWDTITRPKYDIDMKAVGGDGKFLWSSSNHAVGVVTQYGKVHTHNSGTFEISAAQYKNHHNRQTAKFHVLPPSRLEIVEFVNEAEVGSIVFLHVALYADKKLSNGEISNIPFTRCQEVPFTVKMSDPRFMRNKAILPDPVGVSCGNIAIICEEIGTSKITIGYMGDGIVLEDSVTVTYFKPLKLIKPNLPVVIAVGSSINLILSGGPKSGTAHNKMNITSPSKIIHAEDTTATHKMPSDEDYSVVNVVCHGLGSSQLRITSANFLNLPNCKNQETTTNVEIICGKPRQIEMYPEFKMTNGKSCPLDLSSDRIVVQSNRDIDLIVKIKDDVGRDFLNITSLKFDWTVKPTGVGLIKQPVGVLESTDRIGTANYASKSYQRLTPKVESAQFSVRATVTGYRKEILNANKVTAEWPEFLDTDEKGVVLPPMNVTLELYMAEDTIVIPNVVSVYNHAGNRQLLDVRHGSGFYEISLSKTGVADVQYIPKTRQLDIKPLTDGEITVKLMDLCLVSKAAMITVKVISVHTIKVEMSDKVEKGKCISCVVRLYDAYDNLITVPNVDLIDLKNNMDASDIAVITKKVDATTPTNGEFLYTVTGRELGSTSLIFYKGQIGFDGYVPSAPMELQVFPPLKLYPYDMTVIEGAEMQYSTRGGPQPIPALDFTIGNDEIANIYDNGIVKGVSVGHTKVKGRAMGTNPVSGMRIVYAEDHAEVRVIKLTGVKLAAPLTRFQVGATVPMWATGLPEQISPLILATLDPPIEFNWSVQKPDVVKIRGVLETTGINSGTTDMLSVRVTATAPGTTKVYLNATVKLDDKTTQYLSSVDLEVFEQLTLIKQPPKISGMPLLLAPHTTMQLQTNMDNAIGVVTYRVLGDKEGASTDVQKRPADTPDLLITVSSSGMLQSYGNIGSTLVIITFNDINNLKQTLSIVVEVKPIHYMMLSMIAKWTVFPHFPTSVVPLGTKFDLLATYYDNVGNEFAAGTVDLRVITSRFDLITIRKNCDNVSFRIHTKQPGWFGLKVWSDSIPSTADYMKMHVEQTIEPMVEFVSVGDVICFKTPLQREKESGMWSVTDPTLLLLDEQTGVAIATPSKGGFVSISHTLHPAAPLQLHISPVTDMRFDPQELVLTNAKDVVYKAHVVLESEHSKREKNLIMGWNCLETISDIEIVSPINCSIEFTNQDFTGNPSDVFTVTSKYDPIEGKYCCQLQPTLDSAKWFNTLATHVLVTATMPAPAQPKKISLNFLPAVYAPCEIILDDNFMGTLVISGLESILETTEAVAQDDQIILVSNRYLSANKLTYTILLLDYHKKLEESAEFMSVVVKSPQTRQHIVVLVKLHDSDLYSHCSIGRPGLLPLLHSYRNFLGAFVGALIVLATSLYVYSNYLRGSVSVSVITQPASKSACCAAMTFLQGTNPSERTIHNQTTITNDPCYCTRSPEIRRNRRYL